MSYSINNQHPHNIESWNYNRAYGKVAADHQLWVTNGLGLVLDS